MIRTDWLKPIRDRLAHTDDSRGVVACFPDYRPDLSHAMASGLGFVHCDFRRSVMARFGAEAAKLPLSALTDALLDGMERGDGVVLHNAEALLASHTPERRSGWLARALSAGWTKPFVVPVTLFAGELPTSHERVVRFDAADLPAQNLLAQLAGLR